jgi:predicted unusual protein kinase regulating ubiquinone biosynthesis (AarF/ABC1/UbiB family)
MEWIEGTKLTDICPDCDDRGEEVAENLALIKKAIECTLSQLLDTGLLHADPHTGNLLKVRTQDGEIELGYLDFGLVSFVPQQVRDGIVCAVVQVVFARNIEAVADLCVDIELLPEEKLKDPRERMRLVYALNRAFDDILLWPKDKKGRSTAVPKVRFEKLLASLASLIASFEFSVPPYFLNNARALATLEGIALKLDPDFNILRVIYPYSINRLMCNPSVSEKVEEAFLDICRSPETKLFDSNRGMMLLNDWSLLTGYRKRKIFWDLMTSTGGRRVMSRIMREWFLKRFRKVKASYRARVVHAAERVTN